MKISLIKPLDQPPATRRLLNDLKGALSDSRFNNFRIVVAYAKSGPLLRLRELLVAWRKLGKSAEIIVGIDQHGTSKEALQLALAFFDKVYVTQEPQITFHPKLYMFDGPNAARILIGSNNLTVGGTEKNFESAVDIEMSLPAEQATFDLIDRAWSDLLPGVCKATKVLDTIGLAQLEKNGDVLDERTLGKKYTGSDRSNVARGRKATSGIVVKPESPLPKTALPAKKTTTKSKTAEQQSRLLRRCRCADSPFKSNLTTTEKFFSACRQFYRIQVSSSGLLLERQLPKRRVTRRIRN